MSCSTPTPQRPTCLSSFPVCRQVPPCIFDMRSCVHTLTYMLAAFVQQQSDVFTLVTLSKFSTFLSTPLSPIAITCQAAYLATLSSLAASKIGSQHVTMLCAQLLSPAQPAFASCNLHLPL